MYWLFIMMVGYWPILLVVLMTLGMVVFFTGTVGVDGLFAAGESQGTLTCWHCGGETPAGPKRCRHCQGELQ